MSYPPLIQYLNSNILNTKQILETYWAAVYVATLSNPVCVSLIHKPV